MVLLPVDVIIKCTGWSLMWFECMLIWCEQLVWCLVLVLLVYCGVKRSRMGVHQHYYSCIKACLECCGLGMFTIASGREFQSLIVWGKYEKLYQYLLVVIVLNALWHWRCMGWRRLLTLLRLSCGLCFYSHLVNWYFTRTLFILCLAPSHLAGIARLYYTLISAKIQTGGLCWLIK